MFDNAAAAKIARWNAITARKEALKAEARQAAAVAYRAAFSARAREMGGINSRTRDHITEQAKAAAHEAREAVYLRAGYTRCSGEGTPEFWPDENQWMPSECDRLVSPGFAFCPDHTPISG